MPMPKLKCKSATKRGSKKSKPLPDSEPEPTMVAVTRVQTKRSKIDASPPIEGSTPVVINTDSDSDDTEEWQTFPVLDCNVIPCKLNVVTISFALYMLTV